MPLWLGMKVLGLPRWGWALALLAALGGAVWFAVHRHSQAIETLRDESYKKGWGDHKAQADVAIARLEAETLKLTTELKRKTDAQVVRIHVAAERERVLGPGRAAVRCPATAAAAGGYQPPAAAADAEGHPVSAGDERADVPWGWLVSRAATCDLDRNEVQAWRAWHSEVAKSFAKARSAQ